VTTGNESVPQSGWHDALDSLTREHQGDVVTIKATTSEYGDQREVVELPVDKLQGTRISDEAWNASFEVAAASSAYATLACVPTWLTDFRDDLPKIDVPLPVIQGTEDRILPIDTPRRLPELVTEVRFVEIYAQVSAGCALPLGVADGLRLADEVVGSPMLVDPMLIEVWTRGPPSGRSGPRAGCGCRESHPSRPPGPSPKHSAGEDDPWRCPSSRWLSFGSSSCSGFAGAPATFATRRLNPKICRVHAEKFDVYGGRQGLDPAQPGGYSGGLLHR
jgi:hypothetical protein